MNRSLSALSVFLLAGALLAAPAPEPFMTGWSKPVDPDKDCKIRRDKSSVVIEMPGTEHDYDAIRKSFNAPRLFCELKGDFDVQVRVRIEYRPSAQSTVKGQPSFVSAGFLLIYPDGDFDICNRMEFAVSQQGSRLDAYAIKPFLPKSRRKDSVPKGKEADSFAFQKIWTGCKEGMRRRKGNRPQWDHRMPKPLTNALWECGWQNWPLPEKADCAYLRLDYREGWATFFISPDGEKWTELGGQPYVPAKGKVGLAAYSTSGEPSKVVFDQLKLAGGRKKE